MNERDRRRAATRRRRDSQTVKKLLRASERGLHYAVLGMNARGEVAIGTMHTLLPADLARAAMRRLRVRATPGEIKAAYRQMARRVHPDKNRDGRAMDAFRALEASYAILSDEGTRTEYDRKLGRRARKRRDKVVDGVASVCAGAWGMGKNLCTVVKPFSRPIMILGGLVV
mmetsp:Transcript_23217/g.53050  ORF Transcript_23217/g.53050 Transcript_23217/m.53050 type:complete len:171 (-) Transcript_23217:92-604(-)